MKRKQIRNRMIWISVIVLSVFVALMIRLGFVQLVQGDWIGRKAEESWKREIPAIAKRGRMIDRQGVPLVYDVSRPSVMAVPVQVSNKPWVAEQLGSVLNVPATKLLEPLQKRQLVVNIRPGGRNIGIHQAERIRKMDLPGIVVAEDSKRYYPYGMLAAHVLGFTGGDHQGLSGLERTYDRQLQGMNGSFSFFADAAGREIPGLGDQLNEPIDGMDLQLTLDKTIQQIVERELDQAMVANQAEQALAIVMDPKDGGILAMASRPSYDPERFRDYPPQVIHRNLPVWMTYEPGSTFKIVTLAAALEERVIELNKERIHDPGYINVAGARLRCWKRQGHGSETFMEVVQNSCNPGFVMMGQRLGKDRLLDYVRKFGFGKRTGIDLPGEENGILFRPDRIGPVELATTSFGQGVSVTPIQQVAAVAAAVNGGVWVQPHVTKGWRNPRTGQLVKKQDPPKKRRVISEETSAIVREALENVVALGTGRNAYLPGYRVAGKTGTAQKVVDGRYSSSAYIVSFVGFAPANDPKVIVYVAVDHPKGIQFGGVVAAPIVKGILQDVLPYLKVPIQREGVVREERYGDERYVIVPDWSGVELEEVLRNGESIQDLKVETIGQGKQILHQSPPAGVHVPAGSVIRLYMSKREGNGT